MALNQFMQNLSEYPLYKEYVISESDFTILMNYLKYELVEDDSIDIYCIHCNAHSIYKPVNYGQLPSSYYGNKAFVDGLIPFGSIHFKCTRDENHYFGMQIKLSSDGIIKIGQYPSKADIELPDLDKYSRVIPKHMLSDIKKALGLSSHGIGAGSFVYLRRVFEFLINEAYQSALASNKVNVDDYSKSRIVERIVLLKDFLPSFLYENKEVYSILSKGIHELSEEQCLNVFDLLYSTIELILDEMLRNKEQSEKESNITNSISKIHSELRKS